MFAGWRSVRTYRKVRLTVKIKIRLSFQTLSISEIFFTEIFRKYWIFLDKNFSMLKCNKTSSERRKSNMKTAKFNQFAFVVEVLRLVPWSCLAASGSKSTSHGLLSEMFFKTIFGKGDLMRKLNFWYKSSDGNKHLGVNFSIKEKSFHYQTSWRNGNFYDEAGFPAASQIIYSCSKRY